MLYSRFPLSILWIVVYISGFPDGSDIYLQCRRPGFNPWVGKISWRRKWQSTPVFFAREIPKTVEPGKLQSTGLQRVGYIHKLYISLYANPNFPIQSVPLSKNSLILFQFPQSSTQWNHKHWKLRISVAFLSIYSFP